eukprot:11042477-Lingulodinium_polyedra.AAC.1
MPAAAGMATRPFFGQSVGNDRARGVAVGAVPVIARRLLNDSERCNHQAARPAMPRLCERRRAA